MGDPAASETLPKISPDGEINVLSPLDGRLVARVPATPAADVAARAERAAAAQAAWRETPFDERVRRLEDFAYLFAAAGDEFAETLRAELGRHPAESWFAEIVPNIDLVKWWTRRGRAALAPQRISLNPLTYPRKRAWIHPIPRGVLGLITPWNYPVAIPLRSLVPALLAGNAVLWKPSEYAALTADKLRALFAEVLPEGVLEVVQGGADVGQAVVEVVDGVGFTGSVATGRAIGVRAAERLIPSSLELGGKDIAAVLPDADLDRAAAGIAWAALSNAGQNCAAVEICAVHADIYAVFADKLREEIRRMAPYVGPLIHEPQRAKVAAHLEAAVEDGALVLEGGLGRDGLRIEPTLLERVPWSSPLLREETFGPVLPLVKFDAPEALRTQLAQADYGLTLSLWTRDIAAAKRWALGLPVGVVVFNNHAFTAAIPALPWTGVKDTGTGVTNSRDSLGWMVRPQAILEDRARARELWWHPFNAAAVALARALAELNAGVGGKLQRVRTVLKSMLQRWRNDG